MVERMMNRNRVNLTEARTGIPLGVMAESLSDRRVAIVVVDRRRLKTMLVKVRGDSRDQGCVRMVKSEYVPEDMISNAAIKRNGKYLARY